jgi:hypothetical protein
MRTPATQALDPAGAPPDLGPKTPATARGSHAGESSPGCRGGRARMEQSERGGERLCSSLLVNQGLAN